MVFLCEKVFSVFMIILLVKCWILVNLLFWDYVVFNGDLFCMSRVFVFVNLFLIKILYEGGVFRFLNNFIKC